MKILGILMLLFSGVGIAFFLIEQARYVLSRTQAWLEFVRLVRSSVDNYSMSASEILRACTPELWQRLGYPEDDGTPESFDAVVALSDIPDRESREAIESFFGDFGRSYRAEQVLRCDECIDKLRAREKYLVKQLPIKKRIILSVSLCATACALILLL